MTAKILGPPASGKRHRGASIKQQRMIIADKRITRLAKLLAITILNYQTMRLGHCVLSTTGLARDLACCDRQVRRALAELRAVDWLHEEHRKGRTTLRRVSLPMDGLQSPPAPDVEVRQKVLREALARTRLPEHPDWPSTAGVVKAQLLAQDSRERRMDYEVGWASTG